MMTFFGSVPVTIKPPISTWSPVSTRMRVEMLSRFEGGSAETPKMGSKTIVRSAWPEPAALFALMGTMKAPAFAGVPEIRPVLLSIVRPAGRFVAPKLVGLLVAVIW